MIDFKALVISVPAGLLDRVPSMGSIFDARKLQHSSLPADLRLAVDLLEAHAGGATLRCVARPEMFTHDRTLAWLRQRLGAVSDHVSLSDGTSVKLIPGSRNHLFTYGLQSPQRLAEFQWLAHRAPELLPQFESQINSFHPVQDGARRPTPRLMLPFGAPVGTAQWFYGFYLNPHSVEDSTEHMLTWGEFEETKLKGAAQVLYWPLTERALADESFQRALAATIAATYFDPGTCLLIRLPAGGELAPRMNASLAAIRAVGLRLPRARANNIFLLADDLSERSLAPLGARLSFVMHESYEFWRYSQALYQAAAGVRYCVDPEGAAPTPGDVKSLTETLGPRLEVEQPQRALPRSARAVMP